MLHSSMSPSKDVNVQESQRKKYHLNDGSQGSKYFRGSVAYTFDQPSMRKKKKGKKKQDHSGTAREVEARKGQGRAEQASHMAAGRILRFIHAHTHTYNTPAS